MSENFRPKIQNFGLKSPILRKFRGKIEILSTRRVLCQKFAVLGQKIATFCPAYIFNPWPRSQFGADFFLPTHKNDLVCVRRLKWFLLEEKVEACYCILFLRFSIIISCSTSSSIYSLAISTPSSIDWWRKVVLCIGMVKFIRGRMSDVRLTTSSSANSG